METIYERHVKMVKEIHQYIPLPYNFLWIFTIFTQQCKCACSCDESKRKGRNYATSYVYKMLFLQYFHLFRNVRLIFHLMEKEMVVLCGKILYIWIICVSSHPFSLFPLSPLCAVLRCPLFSRRF